MGQGRIIVQIHFLGRLELFGLGQGNLQIEGAAFANHAIHPYATAMIIGNRADNGKSQPRAGLGACLTLFAAIEFLEQVRKIFRCNTETRVFDGKDQITGL
jgi:hypothetical protein